MFDGISWGGVLAAGFVGTLSGGLWFGPRTFFPLWWRLMGHPAGADIKPGGNVPMGVVFGATFLAQVVQAAVMADRKSTRLNSSHSQQSRMPSSA